MPQYKNRRGRNRSICAVIHTYPPTHIKYQNGLLIRKWQLNLLGLTWWFAQRKLHCPWHWTVVEAELLTIQQGFRKCKLQSFCHEYSCEAMFNLSKNDKDVPWLHGFNSISHETNFNMLIKNENHSGKWKKLPFT